MKSYIPPHKRNNNNKVDNFDEPWLSVKNKKRDNLKNANFPSLNKNKDTQDNSLSKDVINLKFEALSSSLGGEI